MSRTAAEAGRVGTPTNESRCLSSNISEVDMQIPEVQVKHLLYATDHSENAQVAFAYAANIAEKFGAQLTLLHVMPGLPDSTTFDVNMERSVSAKKWMTIKKEYLQSAKEEIINRTKLEFGLEEDNIYDIVVETGSPAKMILLVAAERKCDFIVMGLKGKGTLDSLMGDTVRRVLHQSKQPVLVVQPPEV
jgi:nucleotide-binding universal stress UspA family protein